MNDPWFTYYRGRGKMQVTPRNAPGWASLIVFALVIILTGLALPMALERSAWMLIPYLTLVLLLTFAFVRFAIARSERVDLDRLDPKEMAEFREWKRRGKR